jgi:hypothetical protein
MDNYLLYLVSYKKGSKFCSPCGTRGEALTRSPHHVAHESHFHSIAGTDIEGFSVRDVRDSTRVPVPARPGRPHAIGSRSS